MSKTRNLTMMALLLALTCVLAQVSIPNPMGTGMISAITIALCLIPLVLDPKHTFLTIIAYIVLGLSGLPVFVGATSGFGKLLGPTGGFIMAWPIAYTLVSYLKGKEKSFLRYSLVATFVSITISYLIAVPWFMYSLQKDLMTALIVVCFPFLLGDVLKAILAAWIGSKIKL